MVDALFCKKFAEEFASHVSKCDECKGKIVAAVDGVMTEIPFVGMLLKKKLGGRTFSEYIVSHSKSGEKTDA